MEEEQDLMEKGKLLKKEEILKGFLNAKVLKKLFKAMKPPIFILYLIFFVIFFSI